MNTHPAPSEIADARLRAGLSQAAAASLVHLGSKSRWYEYERGSRPIDPARWELFLLKTGQHPDWQAAPKVSIDTGAAGGRGKWYIVDVVVREKILVEISDGEDECDAKEIALGESILFRQTEKDNLEVQVDIEPAQAAPECLEREMRCAHRVIPSWDSDQDTGGPQ